MSMPLIVLVATVIVAIVTYCIMVSSNPVRAFNKLMDAIGTALAFIIAVMGVSGVIISALWAWGLV